MREKNKKGFSLVELLIVISVISIMSAVSITKLMSNKAQKEVEAATREVTAAIREAQAYALTGKSSSGENLCATRFEITSNYSYRLIYKAFLPNTGNSCSTANFTSVYYNKDIRNGISFYGTSGLGTSNNLDFSVPFGIMSSSGTVRITLARVGSYSRSICIYYPTGRVDEVAGSTCP